MPQVIITPKALVDIERLRHFLTEHDTEAAQRAAQTLLAAIESLEQTPGIGRKAEILGEGFRELLIRFGQSGYVAAYSTVEVEGELLITVLALRHQKEAGYQ